MKSDTNWSVLAALRFLLALVVAGSHTIWFRHDSVSSALNSLGSKAAVASFLLISGYSIAASLDRDERSFYFRRFKRIYLVYFFAVSVAVALEVWLGAFRLPFITLNPTGPLVALGNFLFLQMTFVQSVGFDVVVWSLAVEVLFYVLAPILRRMPLLALIGATAISSIFYLLPIIDGGRLYAIALKLNQVKYFWPFAMGFILYYYRSKTLAVALCVTGSALVWGSQINYEKYAPLIFFISFATLIFARTNIKNRKSRFCDYLGDLSYPLYLIQLPTFILAYKLFGVTSAGLLIASAVGAAIVTFELIDLRLKKYLFAKLSSKGPR